MSRPRVEQPKFSLVRRGARYYVQWWEDGVSRRVSCRTEIADEARRFIAEFRAGRLAPQIPAAPTIGKILDGYIQDRIQRSHSATLIYSGNALKRHIADLPSDLLDRSQVRAYMAARRKEGAAGASAKHRKKARSLSDGTLIRELGVLRRALAWAVEEKWIANAPHVERPEAPAPRTRWLTHEDARRLIDAARAPHVRLFVVLALQTAARTSAILDLRWDCVDLDRSLIFLGHGRGRKRRAVVPITNELRRELAAAIVGATCAYVIEHGGERVGSIKTGFRNAVSRAGLTGVTPHVLRHTAATWMVQAGVPLEKVAAFLGNTKEMIERVYGHHSPDYLRDAGAALSRPLAEKTTLARDDNSE